MAPLPRWSLVLVLLALAGVIGCGSEAATPGGGGGNGGTLATGGSGGGGGSGATGGGGSGGTEQECPGPGYPTLAQETQVTVVTARVLDETGAGVADEMAQVCGLTLCINGRTGSDGSVRIEINQAMLVPAFKYGLGLTVAKFAYRLPAGGPEFNLGDMPTVALDPPGTGEALGAGLSVAHGGVRLEIPAGATVKHDRLTYGTPDEQQLRAAPVPLTPAHPAIDASLGFELAFALTPIDTTFCPAARLSVDNTAGWEAGAAVEVWVHGVDVTEEFAPYGGWAKVSDATVSSDGATVSTVAGQGLPVLSVIALRRAP